jgi:hypothetical protein
MPDDAPAGLERLNPPGIPDECESPMTSRTRPPDHFRERGHAKASSPGNVDITLGLQIFVGDDVRAMCEAARQAFGVYTTFAFFQRLFRASVAE